MFYSHDSGLAFECLGRGIERPALLNFYRYHSHMENTALKPTSVNEARKPARQTGWNEFIYLVFAILFGGLAIAFVALAARILGEPAAVFTREPQQVLDAPFYFGSFSNLGGLIWFASAAIVSFAALLKPSNRGALILAALLTWAMGIDDIFMLHDRVYPKLFLNETLLMVLYFGVIVAIVLRFHRRLARSTLVGIAITVFFWVLSGGTDQFFNHIGGQLLEDGTKFIGIAVWAAAWIRQAYSDIATLAHSQA